MHLRGKCTSRFKDLYNRVRDLWLVAGSSIFTICTQVIKVNFNCMKVYCINDAIMTLR